jgi:acyl carrier protein
VNPHLEQVSQWIQARHPEVAEIEPDLDLIDSRLIDSLGFLEFISLIERLTGTPIDVETLDIDDFRSLASIERAFFAVRS